MSFSFGVGCFSFRIVPQSLPITLTLEEYGNRVVEALQQVPNVGKIDRWSDELDRRATFDFDTAPEHLNLSRDGFLYPTRSDSLHFELHIPHRVQEEIFSNLIPGFLFESETFAVAVQGDYYGPVTFVTLPDTEVSELASASIMLVREFLRQQLTPDYGMLLDHLGPSPFHADFIANPAAQDQITASKQSDGRRGYDLIEILYPEDSDGPVDQVQSTLRGDFGLYYETVLKRNMQWQAWHDVQLKIDDLRGVSNAKGRRSWRRKFQLGVLADNALMALTEHEATRVEMTLDSSRALNEESQASPPASRFILEAVGKEVDAMHDWPSQATESLIRLYQQQYLRRLNVAVVLLASIVGGVVGAVVALLAA